MKEKYPIPKWCKEDCIFRDKKAKYMPACMYGFKLDVDVQKEICHTYRKEKEAR